MSDDEIIDSNSSAEVAPATPAHDAEARASLLKSLFLCTLSVILTRDQVLIA